MPRTRRTSAGGYCYHVLNRGNRRERVFHDDIDYATFMGLIEASSRRVPMRVLAWCLMPNHFHLVLWPAGDGDLSRWMHWLQTCQVRRHHRRYGTDGRIWQGRFKGFPIQQDRHLWAVQRYVERNALRAGIVSRAEDWSWSSVRFWAEGNAPESLDNGPIPRPVDWVDHVNEPQNESELIAVRNCVNRQAPFGDERWVESAAERLDLRWTLRRAGRPPSR